MRKIPPALLGGLIAVEFISEPHHNYPHGTEARKLPILPIPASTCDTGKAVSDSESRFDVSLDQTRPDQTSRKLEIFYTA